MVFFFGENQERQREKIIGWSRSKDLVIGVINKQEEEEQWYILPII
jgi:hypothetical protein